MSCVVFLGETSGEFFLPTLATTRAMATTVTSEAGIKAEDVLGHKFDKCLVDTSIKV